MKSLCQKYINMEGCGYSWALGIEKALKIRYDWREVCIILKVRNKRWNLYSFNIECCVLCCILLCGVSQGF